MFQRDVSAISEIDGDDPSFDHFWLNEGAGERISNLVGGLEDVFFSFSISYMGCHPSDELLFFKMVTLW